MSLVPITSRAVGVVMFTTPLKALAPYSAEPGPRTISTLPRSSSGWVMPFHSCEPRNAIARSRPSCSTSTRRLSDELNPRALTLKSFTPLCTTSTPGTDCSAIGAWPVIETLWSTSGGTTEMAAGASTIRSGARDAPSTTISLSEMVTASRPASAVTVRPASTVTSTWVGR